MKNQKHTPGPWEVYRQDSKYIIREALGFDLSSDTALNELDANAALISAAPEMLEVLEWVLNHAKNSSLGQIKTEHGVGRVVDQHLIELKIKSVLKKAKGE